MKLSKLAFGFYLFLGLNLIYACKSKKTTNKPVEKKDEVVVERKNGTNDVFFNRIISQKNSSDALSFQAEADYNDGKQSVTLSMDVSAKRDQYIFLSAKAFGIVNVARVLIQPDSIRIMDMVNRKYISASYQFMRNFSSAPITFEQLQNLAWANAMFDPKTPNTQIDSFGNSILLVMNLGSTLQKATYSKALKSESVVLSEQSKSQEMLVKYGDFKLVDGIFYPHEILINIQAEKKMECKFLINNFATSIKKDPQFVIPKSYKVQVY
jgi:hypothetical protein